MTNNHRPTSPGRTPWLWLIPWLGAGVLLAFIIRNAGVAQIGDAFQEMELAWIGLALFCNLLILPAWTLAWLILLPRNAKVALWRLGEVVAMTALAQNTLPLPLGHAGSAVVLARHGGVESSAVVSVMATQEVVEGAAKVAVLLLAGALAPLPAWMRGGALALGIAAGLLALVLFLISHGLGGQGESVGWLQAFARRLEVLREGRRFLLAFGFLLAMKAAEAGGIFCIQQAFGMTLPLEALPGALGGVMLASLVPFVPANLGTYQAGAYFVYLQLGVSPGPAMAMALVQHLALLGALVGSGFLVLTIRLVESTWPRSLPLRLFRALAFWFHYLFFSGVVGLLALRKRWGRTRDHTSP